MVLKCMLDMNLLIFTAFLCLFLSRLNHNLRIVTVLMARRVNELLAANIDSATIFLMDSTVLYRVIVSFSRPAPD